MAGIRAVLARFLPQGAILLSVLTFTAYGMGLVRDRLFARTYGAGAELDAYNAAFVLPELALDVLVASGLTAPFVPVFTSLARQAADAAPRFAQTVLTLAVMVMAASSLLLLILAPATVRLVAPGFDESSQALYLDLFRLMLLTPIIFAASITLGEVLVAERRFLFYALAPILYNVGIVAGTLLFHDRLGIMAAAVGAVIGACLHLGIRVVGMRHTTVRIRPRLDLRMPALREFVRPDAAQDDQPPHRAADVPVLHRRRDDARGRQRLGRLVRAQLPERAGVAASACRSRWRPSRACPRRGRPATAAASGARSGRNALTIGVLTTLAAIGLVIVGPLAIEVLLGGGRFDAEDVRLTATRARRVRARDPVRRPGPPRRARPVRDPQHGARRSWRRSPGSASRSR